jgi:hypothetical protein
MVTGLWCPPCSMPVPYRATAALHCTAAINHPCHDAALDADVAAIAPGIATLGIDPDGDGDGDAPEGQGRVPVAHGNDRLGGLDEDGMNSVPQATPGKAAF